MTASLLVACVAASVPPKESGGSMTAMQARQQLMNMRGLLMCPSAGQALRRDGCEVIQSIRVSMDSMEMNRYRFQYPDIPPLSIQEAGSFGSVGEAQLRFGDGPVVVMAGTPDRNQRAHRLASAVQTLKEANAQEREAEVRFTKTMDEYRKTGARWEINEDVRRYKIQAESAVRNKQFADAADLYRRALNVAPMWAEGHFNRALILAELEEFGTAVKEMRRYLALVPLAPDARVVQDKIYEWEAKSAR